MKKLVVLMLVLAALLAACAPAVAPAAISTPQACGPWVDNIEHFKLLNDDLKIDLYQFTGVYGQSLALKQNGESVSVMIDEIGKNLRSDSISLGYNNAKVVDWAGLMIQVIAVRRPCDQQIYVSVVIDRDCDKMPSNLMGWPINLVKATEGMSTTVNPMTGVTVTMSVSIGMIREVSTFPYMSNLRTTDGSEIIEEGELRTWVTFSDEPSGKIFGPAVAVKCGGQLYVDFTNIGEEWPEDAPTGAFGYSQDWSLSALMVGEP